jgi:hypothetical protein
MWRLSSRGCLRKDTESHGISERDPDTANVVDSMEH